MQKARTGRASYEFGSSNWTRTSDIRINSPPFYRLNYGGIVLDNEANNIWVFWACQRGKVKIEFDWLTGVQGDIF